MSKTEVDSIGAQVVIPRRNFLVRALGLTAAGATIGLPIVTVENAKSRIEHHAKMFEQAMRDYYAGLDVRFVGNWHEPDYVRRQGGAAHFQFTASPHIPDEYRERYKTWHQYEFARNRDALDKNPWPERLMREDASIISDTPRWAITSL